MMYRTMASSAVLSLILVYPPLFLDVRSVGAMDYGVGKSEKHREPEPWKGKKRRQAKHYAYKEHAHAYQANENI